MAPRLLVMATLSAKSPRISLALTSASELSPARLTLDYFDGQVGRKQRAEIWLDAGQLLLSVADADSRCYPVKSVHWPERQRHGQCQVLLPDGGVLVAPSSAQWHAWALAAGLGDPMVVRWMQSWRNVLLATVLMVAALMGLWRWGTPFLAAQIAQHLPASWSQALGSSALKQLDEQQFLQRSQLSLDEQRAWEARLAQMIQRSRQHGDLPAPLYHLNFRQASPAIGPNAFALPGGEIVVTDQLIQMLRDQPDAVMGVLSHELGHLQRRHALRSLLQASLVSGVAAVVLGDVSSLMVALPVLLLQTSYSRDFEREADASARERLIAAGISPQAMVLFFDRVSEWRAKKGGRAMPSFLSSHPADEERRRYFSMPG